jgi:hypothetical protein
MSDWTVIDKCTGRGRWWLRIRCATCGHALEVTKHGIVWLRAETPPSASREQSA